MPSLAPPSRPTPLPPPSASEDDVVLLDDDEGNSPLTRVNGGAAAAASLSRSSLDTEIKPQIVSGQYKSSNFSRSRKSNLSTSSSGSLSSSSISITKTRDQGLEPITLTVRTLNLTYHEILWFLVLLFLRLTSPPLPQVNKVGAGGIMVQWRRNGASEFDTSKV